MKYSAVKLGLKPVTAARRQELAREFIRPGRGELSVSLGDVGLDEAARRVARRVQSRAPSRAAAKR